MVVFICTCVGLALTDFGGAGIRVEKHAAAVGAHGTISAAKEALPQCLAGFHGLQCEVASHGLGNIVAIIAVLDTLLGDVLNLCASADVSVHAYDGYANFGCCTCSGTKSAPTAPSCLFPVRFFRARRLWGWGSC